MSEDDDTFGNDGGYSSDRGRNRHSVAWLTGQLRDKRMKGGKRGENQKHSDESVASEATGSSESPIRNTRMASRKAEVAEKGYQKRKKTYSYESVDVKENERTDPETTDRSSPPLFSVPAAARIGRAAAASSESPSRNTRMAIRKTKVAEKGHQKRRKT